MYITIKYLSQHSTNNTKGSLCATAYRTVGTDSLCYKYYRYDARGRVIKMWNYIAGLGMKIANYEYNSQNQITELIYQSGYSDSKKFKYDYDYAGRLLNTSISYIPQDSPEDFMVFNSYTYNQNSQISTSKFDPINLSHTYSYVSRSRFTNYACGKSDLFSYIYFILQIDIGHFSSKLSRVLGKVYLSQKYLPVYVMQVCRVFFAVPYLLV